MPKPRILLFNPYAGATSHHETALEVALEYRSKGYEPHFITCQASLPTCDHNSKHTKLGCLRCSSTSKNSLDIIGIPDEHRHILQMKPWIDPKEIPRFSHINELKVWTFNGLPVGEAVAFSIIIALTRDSEPDMERWRFFYLQAIPAYLSIYHSVTEKIKELKPDLVYLFHGNSMAYAATKFAARDCGVDYLIGERAHNEKYILLKNFGNLDLDDVKPWILENRERMLADPKGAEIGASWFHESRSGFKNQVVEFSRKQHSGQLPEGFDRTKRNIAIYASSEDEVQAIPRYMNQWFANQTEGIEYILKHIPDRNFHFYLRVHPWLQNHQCAQRRQLDNLKGSNLTIIRSDSKVDTYDLLLNCEKSLTFGSTVGVEATFWGATSVLAGRAYYEHLEVAYQPTSRENLVELLRADLKPLPKENALAYGYWLKNRETPFRHLKPSDPVTHKPGLYADNRIVPALMCRIIFRAIHAWNQLKQRLAFSAS